MNCTRSPLLQLPAEIRNMIYSYVFATASILPRRTFEHGRRTPKFRCCTLNCERVRKLCLRLYFEYRLYPGGAPILLTCKQIDYEAAGYRQTIEALRYRDLGQLSHIESVIDFPQHQTIQRLELDLVLTHKLVDRSFLPPVRYDWLGRRFIECDKPLFACLPALKRVEATY